jgi:hypothetical protein
VPSLGFASSWGSETMRVCAYSIHLAEGVKLG